MIPPSQTDKITKRFSNFLVFYLYAKNIFRTILRRRNSHSADFEGGHYLRRKQRAGGGRLRILRESRLGERRCSFGRICGIPRERLVSDGKPCRRQRFHRHFAKRAIGKSLACGQHSQFLFRSGFKAVLCGRPRFLRKPRERKHRNIRGIFFALLNLFRVFARGKSDYWIHLQSDIFRRHISHARRRGIRKKRIERARCRNGRLRRNKRHGALGGIVAACGAKFKRDKNPDNYGGNQRRFRPGAERGLRRGNVCAV